MMEEKNIGFRVSLDLLKEIDDIGDEMHLNRTSILVIACREFVDKRKNPDLIKEQIRQALREEPALVAEAVQIYAARQLQKKE
jgi:predicted transcriptional regulator